MVALIEEMEIMILGTGIDIIEVDRIQKAVERWGDVFLNYFLTPKEIEYARKFKNTSPQRSTAFWMRATSMISIPVPRIIL